MSTRKNILPAFLYAALCTLYVTFSVNNSTVTLLPTDDSALEYTLFFLAFFLLFCETLPAILRKKSPLFYILSLLISAVFSLFSIMGKFFSANASLFSYAAKSSGNLFQAVLLFFAGNLLFFAVIRLVGESRGWNPAALRSFTQQKIPAFLQKHPLKLMVLLWIPQILLRYPGTLTIDAINSLKQYWGVSQFTTQHPVLFTVLLGKLMDFGISIGRPALGLYLLVLLQTVLLFLVLAYTLRLLRRLSVPAWLYLLTVLFFALAPIFVSYAATAVIDTLYNIFFLLMMDELVWNLFFHEQYRKSFRHYLLTAISIFGLHFRQNGIYIGLAVFAAGLLMELFRLAKRQQKFLFSLLFLAALLIPALGGKYVSNELNSQYNAKYVSRRAMFALPIQQVSRCLYLHGDEIDAELLDDIQRVLKWDVEDYQELYDPCSFDAVKKGFRNKCTNEDIQAFLNAWLALVQKYPADCADATANMTYFLFSPQVVNQYYYVLPQRDLELDGVDFSEINQKDSFLENACTFLNNAYNAFGYLPVLGLMVNQGFTDLVLLAAALYALLEKKGRLLYLCLPLLLTLAITFVGPMVKGHPRYTYPIMYCLPLLMGVFAVCPGRKQARSK